MWLWKDWPQNWGRDKGIDLVAETHTGELWAIQSKCYDESYYVTKEDVDKFLSESSRAMISYRLLICTTDCLGDNAREVIAAQEKQVGICSLENLLGSSLEWPSVENLQSKITRNPKTPKPHQEQAIVSIMEGFKNHDKGQLYMACGTGKTLVGLWLSEQLKSQNTIVLIPSISLVSQLYHEWVENASTNFIPIFVCSDPTVSDNDQMVTSLYELGFPTTTDPKAILNYFSSTVGTPKVIFSTYHSSPVIKELCTLDEQLTFDLTIADEAHRCAGAVNSDFATIFETNSIRTRRKLFMTATPKVFSDHVKTKAQELKYAILSMDDEEKFGPVFYKLPFSTAIDQDLLSDYEVLISIMDDKTYREYAEKGRFLSINNHESDARTVAAQLLIYKAIKDFELRRIITFHNRKSAAHRFIKDFPITLNLIAERKRPSVGFYGVILGEMLQSKRKSLLKQFKSVENGSSAVLANVRCLSEGVDVPTLDGVVFIDPKGSEIEIVQAVGRAIRKAPNKKKGLIILPVFIDEHDDPEISLEKSCFKPIWKVLNALRAHDDILAEELDSLRLELGRRTYKKPPKLSKITIDLPTSIDASFSDSLELKIIEYTSTSWFYYFGLLERFKEKSGHCNVPQDYPENQQLSTWVGGQRTAYRDKKISQERIKKLEALGFDWDPRNKAWDKMYTSLCEFKKAYGHCNIPEGYVENLLLLGWVRKQRDKFEVYKRSDEFQYRIKKLDELGFDWDPFHNAWEEMYSALCKFREINGHCNVSKEGDHKQLGSWVTAQRSKFNKGKLIQERVDRLQKIGFIWNAIEAKWVEMFAALHVFKGTHGHCNVPHGYIENPPLGNWVGVQRTTYKEKKISQERINKLEALGFHWDPINTAWDEMFASLCRFKEENNHCSVPSTYSENGALSSWVTNVRVLYKNNALEQKRIDRLEEIGFDWDPITSVWEKMYSALCEFKEFNGHSNVPQTYPLNQQLGSWVATQRSKFNKGDLSQERQQRLESIGVIWDPHTAAWEGQFAALEKFKESHNHCNVPKEYPQNPTLGTWVSKQRKLFNQKNLSSERIERLERMEMLWNPRLSRWDKNYNELALFRKEQGHFNILSVYPEKTNFDHWVRTQRTLYKKHKLSKERIQKLEVIDFLWDPTEIEWEASYKALYDFQKQSGHCKVPARYPLNKKLATWVSLQRLAFRERRLPQEKITRLEEIGFDWDPFESSWQDSFMQLCNFKELNGHLIISSTNILTKPLANWASDQRKQHKNGELPKNKILKLETLGFIWDPLEAAWQLNFKLLCEFKEVYGHCNIPKKSKDNESLAAWINRQRTEYKKKTLSLERIHKLEGIGIMWNLRGT